MAQLNIDRGTEFIIGINYRKDGVAHTLVGSTVRFTLKPVEWDDSMTDTSALVLKNVTTGDASGHAEIIIAPSDTSAIDRGKYYYDIKVDENSNGIHVYKVDEGTVKMDGSPTNRLS